VRLVHVFSNTLQPDAVAVKGEVEAGAMSGYKIAAVADPGGNMLYSLYGRNDGRPPFIHALDLEHQFAYCIDIPAIASQRTNYVNANASGWALSLDAGGHMLYASSSLGQVTAIDTNQFSVVRNAGLTAPAASSWLPSPLVDAAAKEFEGPPAASAVAPGGRWLYVAWESGFLAVDTATLHPAALRDRGEHLTSLAVSSRWTSPVRRRWRQFGPQSGNRTRPSDREPAGDDRRHHRALADPPPRALRLKGPPRRS